MPIVSSSLMVQQPHAGTNNSSRCAKGCRSVTPQVFSRSISPNERVNCVDFGQTTVNLGHHLENITGNP
jgi:hypothetical protein